MQATPEQEAWTQGYDACAKHVGQRLTEVTEYIDLLVQSTVIPGTAGRLLKTNLRNTFTDLGFPFATKERIV